MSPAQPIFTTARWRCADSPDASPPSASQLFAEARRPGPHEPFYCAAGPEHSLLGLRLPNDQPT